MQVCRVQVCARRLLSSPLLTSHQLWPDSAPLAQLKERNFSSFNPTLLHAAGRDTLAFFRVSNIHFCDGRESWRDSVLANPHIRSVVALGRLDASSLMPIGEPAVLDAASALFPANGERCPSGPEDARAVWSPSEPHVPWLMVSGWSEDCSRAAMHLLKLPPEAPPSRVELVVAHWSEGYSLAPPSSQRFQKNWAPFVYEEMLLVEYSIEPHVLLHVDGETGRCVPLYEQTSHAPLAEVQRRVGRVSGGAPPVLLASRGIYLGLAHAKASEQMAQHTGTRRMVYHHLFYAFSARPPFALVGAGPLMSLPQPGAQPPTVQFAAGMAVRGDDELLVSYGVLDCEMRLARFSLEHVLRDIGIES